jgi:hypothetical protein
MKHSQHSADAYDESQSDPRKPGHINISTTMDWKNAYVRAAKPGKLNDWIFETLDKAAGFRPE